MTNFANELPHLHLTDFYKYSNLLLSPFAVYLQNVSHSVGDTSIKSAGVEERKGNKPAKKGHFHKALKNYGYVSKAKEC